MEGVASTVVGAKLEELLERFIAAVAIMDWSSGATELRRGDIFVGENPIGTLLGKNGRVERESLLDDLENTPEGIRTFEVVKFEDLLLDDDDEQELAESELKVGWRSLRRSSSEQLLGIVGWDIVFRVRTYRWWVDGVLGFFYLINWRRVPKIIWLWCPVVLGKFARSGWWCAKARNLAGKFQGKNKATFLYLGNLTKCPKEFFAFCYNSQVFARFAVNHGTFGLICCNAGVILTVHTSLVIAPKWRIWVPIWAVFRVVVS